VVHREEKTGVLAEFISKTNAQEMRWIIMIILKGEAERLEISLIPVCASFSVPLSKEPPKIGVEFI